MDKSNALISIVVPVYGCEACLAELCSRLKTNLTSITTEFEIILVNDASPDSAWRTVVQLSANNEHIKGINLSLYIGPHNAITAGLDFAYVGWVVVMDCDLQDRRGEIPKLYVKAIEDYDVVLGIRVLREDNWLKRKSSLLFYKVYDYLAESA